jgi:type III secretion protein C
MWHRVSRILLKFAAAASIWAGCLPAHAAVTCGSNAVTLPDVSTQQDWRAREIRLMVLDQPVSSVLAVAGELAGIGIEVNPGLPLRLRGEKLNGTIGSVLDKLASENNLTWFFDSSRIHVAAVSEIETKIIQAPGTGSREFCNVMRQLNIDGDRQRVVIDEKAATVWVSGPPKFNAMIEGLLRADAGRIDNEITLIMGGKITRHKR